MHGAEIEVQGVVQDEDTLKEEEQVAVIIEKLMSQSEEALARR